MGPTEVSGKTENRFFKASAMQKTNRAVTELGLKFA